MHIDSVGDEFILRMALPLATKSAVDAARAGDDLIVTVSGHRRVLSLPSVLRRCDVVGGEFEDGELRVRFRPDLSVWPEGTQ
jgi:arsenite-transporting ATPase